MENECTHWMYIGIKALCDIEFQWINEWVYFMYIIEMLSFEWTNLNVNVHFWMYIFECTCAFLDVHFWMCIFGCAFLNVHFWMNIFDCRYMCIFEWTYLIVGTCAFLNLYIWLYLRTNDVYVHTYIHMNASTYVGNRHEWIYIRTCLSKHFETILVLNMKFLHCQKLKWLFF
jgi:hypothetical protein